MDCFWDALCVAETTYRKRFCKDAAIRSIAAKLGIATPETLRQWVRQADVHSGQQPGVSSEESAEIRRLRVEVKEPARRWASDFTYMTTWARVVNDAFVVDIYSRAIVGWAAAMHKRATLVLDALQMALWRRDRDPGASL